LAALATLGLGDALAQEPSPAQCDENGRGRGRQVEVCEVREVTFRGTGSLSIVDRTNGAISVRAWDEDEVQVRAVVRATARDLEAARELAASVIISEGNTLRASGPEAQQWWRGGAWWTVDYDVQVPRATELEVATVNGKVSIRDMSAAISAEGVNGEIRISDVRGDVSAAVVNGEVTISDVSGDVSAEAVNGSVELERASGSIDASAVNGRIEVTLVGDRSIGEGVHLQTVNGPVDLRVPRSFSGQLELDTVTGAMDVDFPIMISGTNNRRVSATLGEGGPRVRVETTGGAIRIDGY
jgi:hypothetical protein